jgi:hypothetical protein
MGNLERFKTPTDRIKEQLQVNPDIMYRECVDNIKSKHGITISRALFYRVRDLMRRGFISKRSKVELYEDVRNFALDYGVDAFNDLERLLNNYSKEELVDMVHNFFDRIKNK